MTHPSEHHHTITWSDPIISARAIKRMSGLDYLLSLKDAQNPLPPMYALFNFRFLEVEAGRVLFEATPAPYHCNPVGIVHGGFACTLLDSATALAVLTVLSAGTDLMSLEIKVNFVRPIKVQTGAVRCEGNTIHSGHRVATTEGRITDSEGKLYAHALSTCLITGPDKQPLPRSAVFQESSHKTDKRT
jgi:uncharacterized protein (TIGR00369 family)